jgi:hypothetical protein
MGVIPYDFNHVQKIFICRNIARNMKPEETGNAERVGNLFPVGNGVGVENFQIAVVRCFYVFVKSAHFCGVTFFSTGTIFRTGDDRWKGYGFDFTHFPVALADRNGHCVSGGVVSFHN